VEPNRPRRVPVGEVGGWKLDLLIRDFARFINSEVALLCQGGGRGRPPAVISSWGLGATHEELARPREGGLVGRALPLPRAALEPLHPLLDSSLVHATRPPLRYAAAAPVRFPTAVAGRLIAGFVTPPRDRTLTLWTAESYAALMALYLTDQGALDGLLARGDVLIGCLTYDGMRHELDREINRSARQGLQLSVCVVDFESFKRIDDDVGQVCPDAILALVAGILRTSVRSYDTVGRYGRHELIAILPQTSASEARQLAERLRSQLFNRPSNRSGAHSPPHSASRNGPPARQARSCSPSPTVRCSPRESTGCLIVVPEARSTARDPTGRAVNRLLGSRRRIEELMKPIAALVLTTALMVQQLRWPNAAQRTRRTTTDPGTSH
jgi:diguanylate cyclase (GGDEF)-like protein